MWAIIFASTLIVFFNMKKILVFVFAAIAVFAANAQRPAADIRIKVDGSGTGAAKLVGWYGENQYLSDTADLSTDGYYHFKRDTGYLRGFYYMLMPDKTSFQMLVDDDQSFSMTTSGGQAGYIKAMVVEGSLDNELLYSNLRNQIELEPQFNTIAEELKKTTKGSEAYIKWKGEQDRLIEQRDKQLLETKAKYPNALYTKFKLAGQNPKTTEPRKPNGDLDTAAQLQAFVMQFWDGFDFKDGRLVATPVFFNKMKKYILDFTPQTPDSIIKYSQILIDQTLVNKDVFKFALNWIALKYKPGSSTLMDCDAVYSFLILKYWTPELAFWSKEEEIKSLRQTAKQMQGSLLGKVGQEVRAKDRFGNFRSTAEITEPIMIVYIYSPNCSHCQEQTPVLTKLAKEYTGKVGVYSIVTSTTPEEWAAYANKVGYTWPDVYDPQGDDSKWPLKYHVDNTPEIYVLNKERVFVGKNLHADQLQEVIDRELLKIEKAKMKSN